MARLSAEEMFKNMIGRKDEEPQALEGAAAAALASADSGDEAGAGLCVPAPAS